MMLDMKELEKDDKIRPFGITRSTQTKNNDQRVREFTDLGPIFKALRQGMADHGLIEPD